MTTTKVARFLRELDRGDADWVRAYLFKLNPPIEWTSMATYRKGKLLHDPIRGMPHRIKKRIGDGSFMREKPRAIYSHGYRTHTTAFIVASCSDLKTMMARGNRKMREEAEKTLKYLRVLKPSSTMHAQEIREGIDKAREIIRLFKPEEDERFEVETYLFPAYKDGNFKDWSELAGSQRGTLDPRVPLNNIGYQVIGLPKEPINLKVEINLET